VNAVPAPATPETLEQTFALALRALLPDHIGERSLAVGVSGGSDSLALALLLSNALKPMQFITFCVDHGLRHGSAAEARWTQKQLQARGLQCVVLTVETPDFPAGNTQAAAREARYRLMASACERYGCGVLCTAHTLDDQAETVLARLARGSGTRGLRAMAALSDYPVEGYAGSLIVARPLLDMRRDALRNYLRSVGQRWAQDPSNRDEKYDRIRLRSMISTWEKAGFSVERIASSAENMRRSEAALEHYTTMEMARVFKDLDDQSIAMDRSAFLDIPGDIQLRLLKAGLKKVSGNRADVRMAKLNYALDQIKTGEPHRYTLHGCIIELGDGSIRLLPESREKPDK
jgi:tRNA(Ile)-lysidine synthase